MYLSLSAGSLWATHGHDLFNVGNTGLVKSTLPDARCSLDQLVATADSIWGRGYCGVWQFNIAQQSWTLHPLNLDQAVLIIADSNGTVYAGGSSGLYSYLDSEWKQVAVVDVTVAAADKQGGLWLASRLQGELWHYTAGQLTAFGQRFNANGVLNLIVDNQNRLWATYTDALVRCDRENWQYIHSPVLDIDRIATDPAGRIWVTGRRSTSLLSDAAIAVYDPALEPQP